MTSADPLRAGEWMHAFATQLYPICRSITGNGVRETLTAIGEHVPITVHEISSGTRVFDWEVPREWNVREAWIKRSNGEVVVDFAQSNLHLMSYSVPVHTTLSLEALQPRLHSLPANPDWIPYRTSYYSDDWGFCLPDRLRSSLPVDQYEVFINATLEPGTLTYGECVLEGSEEGEILISCHVCHPSMGNDNLSGIAVATALARHLASVERHYTVRTVFLPATIGSITWLAMNEAHIGRIKAGIVLSCVGDAGMSTYKQSRLGDSLIDRAFAHVLQQSGQPHRIEPFVPFGYDERQYCSPAFNLPVGALMRTPNGRFPEYHTSADNLAFIHADALADSLHKCIEAIAIVQQDARFLNLNPKCEPQLGRRGLYRAMAGEGASQQQLQLAMLWVLNQSDGTQALLDIAIRAAMPFALIHRAAMLLQEHDLLQRC